MPGCKLNFRHAHVFLPVSGDFVGSLETLAHMTYAFAHCQVLVINSCSRKSLQTAQRSPCSSVDKAVAYWSSGPGLVNGVPLHNAFHYYPPIVLIWLVEKDVKSQVIHPSSQNNETTQDHHEKRFSGGWEKLRLKVLSREKNEKKKKKKKN